jgi:hypothetical protein
MVSQIVNEVLVTRTWLNMELGVTLSSAHMLQVPTLELSILSPYYMQ